MGDERGRGKLKHRPETVWRLVEAHCKQITDALSAARVPLVLGLTWAFIWAWSLYAMDLGYIRPQFEHVERLIAKGKSAEPKDVAKVREICLAGYRRADPGDSARKALKNLPDDEFKKCLERMEKSQEWTRKQLEEVRLVSFPGGLAKTTVADLGVVGQAGLILILAWGFFSTRREYQAVRAMVDIRVDPAGVGWKRTLGFQWSPQNYILVPAERHFSAEHLAYAYHSVAQRFLFILTDESRPLPVATVLLLFFPALVATFNLGTDVRDVVKYGEAITPVAQYMIVAEALLLFATWAITLKITRLAVQTAVLLHGWKLAVSQVWMEQWDERDEDSATPIYVDRSAGGPTARAVTNGERTRYKLPAQPPWPAT
jgi:hypothetical protein